jgi:glycerophosphoryl diester phosphodiesterase
MTRPLLLGHRGARASRNIAENTLASFELCLQHGCDGFEFDVRRSVDGEAVICHDQRYKGREIAKAPAKILALPTLEDVLQAFSSRAFLDIELKIAGLEQQTIAALLKHPPQRGYVVSSFLPDVLRAANDLDGNVPLGLLCENRHQLPMESRAPRPAKLHAGGPFDFAQGKLARTPVTPQQLSVTWVIPRVDLVDQALVKEFHAVGKKIMVWTVNRAETMRQLSDWGVDAIISDETERVAQVVLGL